MCVVSMISDHYMDKYRQGYQGVSVPPVVINAPNQLGGMSGSIDLISRYEFESLKKDVLEMKELLKRAKLYDERTGQPDCVMDEKVAMLKKIAQAVGVSLDDVFETEKK